jgi:hypothetical protein
MKTTTNMTIELSAAERQTLINAYIPTEYEHQFTSSNSDAELFEVFQAYANFDSSLADQYLEYVVNCSNEEAPVEVLTAKSWIEMKKNQMSSILDEWESFIVADVDFGDE